MRRFAFAVVVFSVAACGFASAQQHESAIEQGGESQVAYVTQSGPRAESEIEQWGRGHLTTVDQVSTHNAPTASYVLQIDQNATAYVSQAGYGWNYSRVSQGGDMMQASVTQDGSDLISEVHQYGGAGSIADVGQWGEDKNSYVEQNGDGHIALISQFSALASASAVYQAGVGNSAIVSQ
ncbi:hypothetical protein U91I_01271 [alpha proteobacterium U9-1i]|nr:hypothetical protein U91I_01271 [alpha proteobacterium U9-1i]